MDIGSFKPIETKQNYQGAERKCYFLKEIDWYASELGQKSCYLYSSWSGCTQMS